jgi:hypothetical protein
LFSPLCSTLDAHGRDIIQKLMLEGVNNKKAFQWQSQLKQRWEGGEAKLAIADARFNYQFEVWRPPFLLLALHRTHTGLYSALSFCDITVPWQRPSSRHHAPHGPHLCDGDAGVEP